MSGYRYTLGKFLKDWMLVVAMTAGVILYLTYHAIPSIHTAGPFLKKFTETLQPILLFLMLFLSFCKIEPHQMKPHFWHLWLLLIQGGGFTLLALAVAIWPGLGIRIPLEAAMLCIICPTATACAVVTGKLGGNMAGVVTYTILINLLAAILVPLLVPLVHPAEGITFAAAFSKILAKVFPLLIMPCLSAWIIRYVLPGVHAWLLKYSGMSFYIWTFALTMAIATSTRYIVANGNSGSTLSGIALASLLCCAFQFWAGKRIGAKYGFKISAGQAIGQKNTVFAIWMGYTFMSPITSVAGGFYSLWHNSFNTWQLYRRRKEIENGKVYEGEND